MSAARFRRRPFVREFAQRVVVFFELLARNGFEIVRFCRFSRRDGRRFFAHAQKVARAGRLVKRVKRKERGGQRFALLAKRQERKRGEAVAPRRRNSVPFARFLRIDRPRSANADRWATMRCALGDERGARRFVAKQQLARVSYGFSTCYAGFA